MVLLSSSCGTSSESFIFLSTVVSCVVSVDIHIIIYIVYVDHLVISCDLYVVILTLLTLTNGVFIQSFGPCGKELRQYECAYRKHRNYVDHLVRYIRNSP